MSVDDIAAPTSVQEVTVGEEENFSDPPRSRFFYSRFWMDLTGTFRRDPTFRATDVLHKTDGTTETKLIDVPATFSPPMGMKKETTSKTAFILAKTGVIIWKLFLFLSQALSFLLMFAPFPNAIWFAYLTNWALFIAIIYSGLSLFNSIFPIAAIPSCDCDDPKNASKNGIISNRTTITWAFFTLAAFLQTMVTVLYFGLLHPPGLTGIFLFWMVWLHGGVWVLILIDGFLVNRIPIRMRHWLEICLPFTLMYALWSLLQSPLGFDLENPYMDAVDVDDDKIYP